MFCVASITVGNGMGERMISRVNIHCNIQGFRGVAGIDLCGGNFDDDQFMLQTRT